MMGIGSKKPFKYAFNPLYLIDEICIITPVTIPKAMGTQILAVGGVRPNKPLKLATNKNIPSHKT